MTSRLIEQTSLLANRSGAIKMLNSVSDWATKYSNYKNYLVDQYGDPANRFTNTRNLFDDLNSMDKEWFKVAINQFSSLGRL